MATSVDVLKIMLFALTSMPKIGCSSDYFTEKLVLTQLPNGYVHAEFNFLTIWKVDTLNKADENLWNSRYYRLFPMPLGEIIHKHNVQELHLSLTNGKWRHQIWHHSPSIKPPGAQVWAYFNPALANDTLANWINLNQALSGLICSSLNFIDGTNHVNPKFNFRPEGATIAHDLIGYYAALPQESVCTENLTPWKKLLPCNNKAGLAILLHPLKMYDTAYHSLSLDVKPVLDDGVPSLELSQTLSVVFDNLGSFDWKMSTLFGMGIFNVCPVASKSEIEIRNVNEFTPKADYEDFTNGTAIYDLVAQLKGTVALNIVVKSGSGLIAPFMVQPPVTATRFLIGYGMETAGIKCRIRNNYLNSELLVSYMEVLPWYMRVYYHSLQIKDANGNDINLLYSNHVPSRDRLQIGLMEFVFILKPLATADITFSFEKAFLKWSEFPPDANHGFTAPSAIISSISLSGLGRLGTDYYRTFTETLLISMPVPDFSMPYNVICLTCTVVALAFGPIHNITTKSLVEVTGDESDKPKGKLARLKDKIKGLFCNKVVPHEHAE